MLSQFDSSLFRGDSWRREARFTSDVDANKKSWLHFKISRTAAKHRRFDTAERADA